VQPDGSITGGRVFAETIGAGEGRPDGMKLDTKGHVYCTGPGGIHVFDRTGKCLGVIRIPERPTNLAWGDDDFSTLYVTAQTSLYRARLETPGHRPY
jgi:gluconolactonase